MRKNHLGCYGYDRSTSPTIDKLANSGVVFDNMISSCSWTLPSHASMLTGMYPSSHGLQDDGVKLSPEISTLAEKFKNSGYYSFAVVSHVYVSSAFGLDRGFDLFDDSLIRGGTTNPIASQVVDRFIKHARKNVKKPYFAFVHLFDPHWSYSAPPPFNSKFTDPAYDGEIDGSYDSLWEYIDSDREMSEADRRQMIALYDGEIAYTDFQIGRLLKFMDKKGLLENTVVVLTADHGEEFKEHGRLGHGKTLYGEQLQVPLIISEYPGVTKGYRKKGMVSPCDIMPTLLAMTENGIPDGLQGKPIMKVDENNERIVYAESIRFGLEMWSARNRFYKAIYNLYDDKWVFYDLRNDPMEQHPVLEDPSGDELKGALTSYMSSAAGGWHVKFVDTKGRGLCCYAEISTDGKIINPRHYFSKNISESTVDFKLFRPRKDGTKLSFYVEVKNHMGEVVFITDPPQAEVTFDINIDGSDEDAQIFFGRNEIIETGEKITLRQSDDRVSGVPEKYGKGLTGVFVRVVQPADELSQKTDLPEQTIEHLRSLGYIQ